MLALQGRNVTLQKHCLRSAFAMASPALLCQKNKVFAVHGGHRWPAVVGNSTSI